MKRPYALSLIVAGIFATNAPADRVDDVGHFMNWATQLSGYPAPTELPTVYLLSNSQITALYCRGRVTTDDCSISGFYRTGQVLYINRDLPMREIEATIVHEMVHYLQTINGQFTSRCKAELEANRVEWSYNAVVYGSRAPFTFNAAWYNC